MKPEAVRSIVQFAQGNTLLASHFRVIARHAEEGRKAPGTIQKLLIQRTRFAINQYRKAFGEDYSSGATEREAAKRLAEAFGIKTTAP